MVQTVRDKIEQCHQNNSMNTSPDRVLVLRQADYNALAIARTVMSASTMQELFIKNPLSASFKMASVTNEDQPQLLWEALNQVVPGRQQ